MTPDAMTRLFKEAYNTTVVQQLTSANLALTTSNVTLTAANKKLLEALAKVPATKDVATASNTMGGSEADKGWNTRRT